MSLKEESLDEKIARIRKQNEKIERRKKIIDEEIKAAKRNNAVVKLKNKVLEANKNDEFGATLYSDQLSPERKVVKPFEEDIWNAKPSTRKSAPQTNNTDEEWREERKRIDEERIRRQKANSGSWKREWDADKSSSSNDHDNKISKDSVNRSNRISSVAERPENRRTYNFNESRESYNHYNTNEDDSTHNRWKTDSSFRKTYSERRTTDNYDNWKSSRNESWRTNVSESDQYNNNATKSFSRNSSKTSTQNTPFATKNNEFREESWDTAKPNSKISSQNDIQNRPFTNKNNQIGDESWDNAIPNSKINSQNNIQNCPFTSKNNQFGEESWDTEPTKVVESVEPKSNKWQPAENAKPQAKSQDRERSSASKSRGRPSCGFSNRIVLPNKSMNANNPTISKSPENKQNNTGENDWDVKDCETSGIISKDLKNIVIHVGNLGISSDKREVRKFNDLKNDFNVPNFSNTNRESDFTSSPNYGSMTFERSDLKKKITPIYSEHRSPRTSVATQMFSNSKLSNADANSKLSNFTRTIKNDEQKSPTPFQSPTVFQFSATPSKLDIGDIVHNITPQNGNIIRTIKSENIIFVKKSPVRNTSNEHKNTINVKKSKDVPMKTDQVKCSEVVQNEELDEDEEWDDCSDEDIEEEFI